MSSLVSLEKVYDKVIFDMDGTLVDSRAVVEAVWRSWALKHGVSADNVLAMAHGRRTQEVVRQFAPRGIDADREAREIETGESDAADNVCAIPGALELVRWIPDGDWAVVTSATRELAARRLLAAGFRVPEILVSADDVSVGKPNPEGYLLAIERMRARPENCLVFEDAHAGILAAKGAGCDVVAITAARVCDFDAECPAVPDFHSVSFAMRSAMQPRRWAGRHPSAVALAE